MPQPPGFVPIDRNTHVVGCFGWTEFQGSKINEHFLKARVQEQEFKVENQVYPAIVYQFVAEEGVPDIDTIVSQADFFISPASPLLACMTQIGSAKDCLLTSATSSPTMPAPSGGGPGVTPTNRQASFAQR